MLLKEVPIFMHSSYLRSWIGFDAVNLLCTLSGEGSSTVSPLTPGELLIALHNIDSTKCDMKSIIKGNCFRLALFSWTSTQSSKFLLV